MRLVHGIVVFFLMSSAWGGKELTERWGMQFLTPTNDTLFSWMVVDSNDGICMATLQSPLDGEESPPPMFLLRKLTKAGEEVWSTPLGKNAEGDIVHLAVDGLAVDGHENVYVFGHTNATLGEKHLGKNDFYLAKYDRWGIRQWNRQFGTLEHDVCTGVAIDANDTLYLAGYSYGDFANKNQGKCDLIVAAYDKKGECLWKDQFGTEAEERASDLRLGMKGDLYVCGNTNGSAGRPNNGLQDIVIARYSRGGKRLWANQYGTPAYEQAVCLVIGEQGQVYVSGRTEGDLAYRRAHRGNGDAFTIRFDEEGLVLWKRQYGSRGWEKTFHMAPFRDGSGDVLVGGCQYPNGVCQGFCRRYTEEGDLVWKKEFRKRNLKGKGGTCGRSVAVDSENNCYHAGGTSADNWVKNNGTRNVYLVRFDGSL